MPEFKCLVIEDDLFYRTYVADLLSDLDVEILSAADGEAGLALAVSEKPDLIITDIEIPKIQGFVLLRMIRERPEIRDIPVILMSGKVEKDLLERHSRLRDRADGYLVKPFSGQDLMVLVKKALDIDTGLNLIQRIPEKDEAIKTDKDSKARSGEIELKGTGANGASKAERSLKALVVDDSRYICDIARDFLQEIGFVVKIARDGEEGLKEALDFVPDLVLLDVQMPKMNGYVVCEMLRKEETTRNTLIFLMSAIVDGESFEKHSQLRYHADAYLQKPFMKSELQDMVSRLIPRAGRVRTDLEGKTGFLIPSSDELAGELDVPPGPKIENSVNIKMFSEMRSSLESLKRREVELENDLNSVRVERDLLEDEVFTLRSSKEGSEKKLQDKITLLTQRFEETRSLVEVLERKNREYDLLKAERKKEAIGRSEREGIQGRSDQVGELEKECQGLRRDLSAALSAKNEIEEQVKFILEKRQAGEPDGSLEKKLAEMNVQNTDLRNRAEEAESRIRSLSDVESQLTLTRKELSNLQVKLEESGRHSNAEFLSLKNSLAEAVKRSGTLEEQNSGLSLELEKRSQKIIKLETELARADELASSEKAEREALQSRIDNYSGIEDQLSELEKQNAELQIDLEKSEKLRGKLEQKIGELTAGIQKRDETNAGKFGERLDKLEAALKKTVLEAQTVIDQQSARESQLQENMRSLMDSLQSDREAFKEEKERWRNREEELRTAFEDALAENRRIMGEETARLHPMLIPKKTRPLEVVTGTKRYLLSAAMAGIFLAVFVLGYLVFSRIGEKARIDNFQNTVGGMEESGGDPAPALKKTRVSPTLKDSSYEDIWRRQTVQSVSDDMMIQATLHTLQELEAAVMYTADKEGWTRQRKDNALQELMDVYKLDDNYYVTVYSKNLREGYPGYADHLEKHVALRDNTGRETMGLLPAELAGSKFITSRVSAAGRELSPDYLYEVGMTISFSRDNLVQKPEELQLVIYDVGAVPMRILTWEISETGS